MKFCLVKSPIVQIDLKNKSLTEAEKKYILNIIRFKPAGFIIDNNVYVGGTKQNMLQVMKALAMSKGMLRFWPVLQPRITFTIART
jgi:hypothetical protein